MPKAVKYLGVCIKQCSKCKEFKKVEEFHRDSCKSDGLYSQCKECAVGSAKRWYTNNREWKCVSVRQWRVNNPKRYWAKATLDNHRRKGFEVNITIDALTDLAKNTKTCSLCGCELNWSYGTKNGHSQPNSPSLDRIDNTNTLTLDNIQIICNRCNATKFDRSMKEFVDYCKMVVEKFGGLGGQSG